MVEVYLQFGLWGKYRHSSADGDWGQISLWKELGRCCKLPGKAWEPVVTTYSFDATKWQLITKVQIRWTNLSERGSLGHLSYLWNRQERKEKRCIFRYEFISGGALAHHLLQLLWRGSWLPAENRCWQQREQVHAECEDCCLLFFFN